MPGRKEKKKGIHKGVKVSIEGVNGLHQKYYQQIENHHAVRGFACLLLSHIHVCSEQYRRQRERGELDFNMQLVDLFGGTGISLYLS